MFSFELKSYENCFDLKNAKMLFTHENENHVIDLKFEKESSYDSLYALSEKEFQVLQNYLLKNLALNRIREFFSLVETSMLFVFKKNESLRLCVNYRDLNVVIIKNRCFFSLIEKTLNRLINTAYFTKLDFKNVYHRIRIWKNDEWMIVFRTRYDHFEYVVMSFDLFNVSTTFQILINKALRDLMNHICVIYFDDILIYSKTRKKHWDCVMQILKWFRKFKLYAKLFKCFFMIISVKFLKYIINNGDIVMNSNRVKFIKIWFKSKTLRKLQMFLKFVNFYRRFIRFYARIIRALTKLFKNNKNEKQNESFNFNAEAREAFQRLIDAFIKIFMLVHFDSKSFIRIKIDVSKFVIAAILFQLILVSDDSEQRKWHLVVFYSRKMIFAKTRYKTHDQELLAIVMTFKQ